MFALNVTGRPLFGRFCGEKTVQHPGRFVSIVVQQPVSGFQHNGFLAGSAHLIDSLSEMYYQFPQECDIS
jgi:hypothetical protein